MYGARLARKQWGFTTGVALSLALGLGAVTAVFNLTFNLILADLPVPHPAELVALARHDLTQRDNTFTWTDYQALRQTPGVGTLAAWRGASAVSVAAGDRRDLINIDFVDGSYFPLVGIRPLGGRFITTEDDSTRAQVIVLASGLAARLFASDSAAVGQTILLRGVPFAVVGVTPRSFRGLVYPGAFAAAIPMGAVPLLGAGGARDNFGQLLSVATDQPVFQIVSRLGAPRRTASSALAATFRRCCRRTPGEQIDLVDSRHGIPGSKQDFRGTARTVLTMLMFGTGLVLVVVCCNIASLLLVRTSARTKETAVRLALGGSRGRLVSQLILENAVPALLGALGSLVVAAAGTSLFVQTLPSRFIAQADLTSLLAFRPGLPLLGFAALVTLACVVGFSLLPALRATELPLAQSLRLEGRAGRTKGQGTVARGVVTAQVAVTVVLVTAASLFAVTLRTLSRVNGGFAVDHMLLTRLEARSTRFEQAGLAPIAPEILRRVRAVPGVRAAAVSTELPLYGGLSAATEIKVPGYTGTAPEPTTGMSGMPGMRGPDGTPFIALLPGYFEASGIRLAAGRDFLDADAGGAEPVTIISAAFQRRYFPGPDPLGQTFAARLSDQKNAPFTTLRVVGVAGDAKYNTLRETPQPLFYVPLVQAPGAWTRAQLLVRTEGDPLSLARPVAAAIDGAAPGLNVLSPQDMQSTRDQSMAIERLAARLAASVSAMALLLSAVGLYGVIAYSVSRRTSEIGIRLALGAPAPAVLWLVARETLIVVGVGVAVGIPLSLAASAAIQSQLYGVGAFSPIGTGVAVGVLAVAGLIASLVPARRAARIDPKVALNAV